MRLLPLDTTREAAALPPPGAVHTYAHGRCHLLRWGRDQITDEVCASISRRDHLMYLSHRYVERLEREGRISP